MAATPPMTPERFRERFAAVEEEIGRVIVGMRDVVRGALMAVMADGNVLLEGVPGVGKTQLVKAIGDALHLSFARIQFTPDLMPADITGTNLVVEDERQGRTFRLHKGPVFHHIVLADEINRATPKTQSALLEAMQERQVTIVGQTHPLPQPFFVVATQNPLEMEGTYPLPEAQLDRFLLKLKVEFPDLPDLRAILDRTTSAAQPAADRVLDGESILAMRRLVREVPAAPVVMDYAIRLVLATHPQKEGAPAVTRKYIRYGASPRGAQALVLCAKIRALLEGRLNASTADVRAAALPVLRHRVILNFEGEAEGVDPDRLLTEVLASVSES